MSHSQFQSKRFILRRAWLNLWDERMTTGRINQVAILLIANFPSRDCLSRWTVRENRQPLTQHTGLSDWFQSFPRVKLSFDPVAISLPKPSWIFPCACSVNPGPAVTEHWSQGSHSQSHNCSVPLGGFESKSTRDFEFSCVPSIPRTKSYTRVIASHCATTN
jgi:hypothetical protein